MNRRSLLAALPIPFFVEKFEPKEVNNLTKQKESKLDETQSIIYTENNKFELPRINMEKFNNIFGHDSCCSPCVKITKIYITTIGQDNDIRKHVFDGENGLLESIIFSSEKD